MKYNAILETCFSLSINSLSITKNWTALDDKPNLKAKVYSIEGSILSIKALSVLNSLNFL